MGRADGSCKKNISPAPGLKPGATTWIEPMALHKHRYFLLRNDVLPKIEIHESINGPSRWLS